VLEFEGLTHYIFRGDLSKDVLKATIKGLPKDDSWLRLTFRIWADENDLAWTFKPQGISWWKRRPYEDWFVVRDQTLHLLAQRLCDLDPSVMLSANCLACGKALTDPASRARCIGPECWGSSSLTVPWMNRGLPSPTAPRSEPNEDVQVEHNGSPEESSSTVLVAQPQRAVQQQLFADPEG
jgi:hypothetical protein